MTAAGLITADQQKEQLDAFLAQNPDVAASVKRVLAVGTKQQSKAVLRHRGRRHSVLGRQH